MMIDLPNPSAIPGLTVIGNGKLGSAVAMAWERQGGEIARKVHQGEDWTPEGLVFEATAPEAALPNLLRCVDHGIPVVTGTTGWLHDLPLLKSHMGTKKSSVFWSTNFSPGVFALNAIAQYAAGVMAKLDNYEARISETHHIHKLDAPSGTALTLEQHVRLGGWSESISMTSKREGDVIGFHSLAWDSDHDSVVLHHKAKSRQGFAEGAVWALRWTWARHQQGNFGLYTMTDLFEQ